MGSVGAVGAAPVLSRDVVVAAVRDLAYVLSCCSDVSAALAGPFPLGAETWPLALPPLPHSKGAQCGCPKGTPVAGANHHNPAVLPPALLPGALGKAAFAGAQAVLFRFPCAVLSTAREETKLT